MLGLSDEVQVKKEVAFLTGRGKLSWRALAANKAVIEIKTWKDLNSTLQKQFHPRNSN